MKNVNTKTFWLCICAGVIIRYILMSLGHNFDFDSYCIVGELASAGKNIYANTTRYNYGPVWFTVLGLFWKAASYFEHSILLFRCLIVGTLTLTDFFLAKLICRIAGTFWGLIFFLNPISLIITGYHNQFDNLAVLIGVSAVLFIKDSCSDSKIKPADLYGTVLLSLSLITKHIMWAFPLWLLLNTKINPRKKVLYAFVPPLLFLLSFTPYWSEGVHGIISNVFLYKSFNNFPLFALRIINYLGVSIPLQEYICLPIFGLLMLAGALLFRRESIDNSFLLYTIALVCFSSAIANQYLAIPCMAVILIFRNKSALYLCTGLVYLSCSSDGLHIPYWLSNNFGCEFNLLTVILSKGSVMYTILAWCLLFYLIHYCCKNMSR